MIVSVFLSLEAKKPLRSPLLAIFSDFLDKNVCYWFDVFLARNIFSVRFLQEMYFVPESCKICIFCQDLARILQELYLFLTREVKY